MTIGKLNTKQSQKDKHALNKIWKESFDVNWMVSLDDIRDKKIEEWAFNWAFEKWCSIKQDLVILWMDNKDIEEHWSDNDLYIKKTKISEEYIKWFNFPENIDTFTSELEEDKWSIWYDIPFWNDKFHK